MLPVCLQICRKLTKKRSVRNRQSLLFRPHRFIRYSVNCPLVQIEFRVRSVCPSYLSVGNERVFWKKNGCLYQGAVWDGGWVGDDDDKRLTCLEMTESLLRHDKKTVKESSAERGESSDDCRT